VTRPAVVDIAAPTGEFTAREPPDAKVAPDGASDTLRAPIGWLATADGASQAGAPEIAGLSYLYMGDHWAWRTGYCPPTLAWSTQHPPGGRSVLNRDQAPRGLR
jgi:hypothetical protein